MEQHRVKSMVTMQHRQRRERPKNCFCSLSKIFAQFPPRIYLENASSSFVLTTDYEPGSKKTLIYTEKRESAQYTHRDTVSAVGNRVHFFFPLLAALAFVVPIVEGLFATTW